MVPTPDSKWASKHTQDLINMMERMAAAAESEPLIRIKAMTLADGWLTAIPEAERPKTPEAFVSLISAATDGLALASLYPPGAPTPREIYETLLWVPFLLMPEDARPFATAYVYAVQAGHFAGREKNDAASDYVVGAMDWADGLTTSARAAAFADSMKEIFGHLCDQAGVRRR